MLYKILKLLLILFAALIYHCIQPSYINTYIYNIIFTLVIAYLLVGKKWH